MQAGGLLQKTLGFAGRLQLVHRCCLRHEETERIKVRAADAVLLHHAVRTLRAQAQFQVVVADVVLHRLVRHRPLVHAEATELPLLRGSVAQDLVGEGEGGSAALHKIGDVHRDGGGGIRLGTRHLRGAASVKELLLGCGPVETPGGALGRIQQNDAGAGVPALELAGLERVVGEEEVFHGVHFVAGATLRKRVGVSAGTRLMRRLCGTPMAGIHHLGKNNTTHASSLNDAATR